MTPTETTRLLHLVVQIAPAQRVDEFTADAWHLVLSDLPYDVAQAAVVQAARTARFIAPADVVAAAKALYAQRPRPQHDPAAVPDADPDDPRAYAEALRAGRMRTPDPADLKPRPIAEAMRRALERAPAEVA
jgi:uncharacterized protein YqfA (UPF0365 family)